MNIEEQLGILIAAAEEQEKTAKEAVSALTVAVKRLETTSETLKTGVEGAISENMWKVSQAAEKSLQGASKAAYGQLNEASSAIVAAQKWLLWRWAAIAGAIALTAITVVWGAIWAITDSYRAELAEAKATIAQLEAKGSKAKLSTCGGKLCVAIVPGTTYGEKKDPYMVLRY